MICAGHYPRQHFTVAELWAMPVYELGCGGFAPEGWNRSTDDRGHPVAFYQPTLDDPKPHCVVRPVVRVKAPTRRGCCNKACAGCPDFAFRARLHRFATSGDLA